MRALILASVAACATAPPQRFDDLAAPRTPAAPPLPAYHGAVLDDPCVVELHPDSAALQSERRQAMLARLRPGARVTLDAFGVRPDRIVLPPGGPGPVRNRAQAVARAKQFLAGTAELWGISTQFHGVGVDPPTQARKGRARWWAVEIVVGADPAPAWARAGRIAMLIDADTGRVAARLARGIDPYAEICTKPASTDDRYVAAVLAADLGKWHVGPLDASSVGKPRYDYVEYHDRIQLVVEVPIQERGNGETRQVALDASTAQILAVVPPRMDMDDWLQPSTDASALLDDVEPERDSD